MLALGHQGQTNLKGFTSPFMPGTLEPLFIKRVMRNTT